MNKNKLFAILGAIAFGVIFTLISIESVFNILGMWTAWSLFGFLIGLLLLPALNALALISAVASIVSFGSYKKTNDNVCWMKYCFLPILFFTLGFFLTVIAYIFVFTWGFGV